VRPLIAQEALSLTPGGLGEVALHLEELLGLLDFFALLVVLGHQQSYLLGQLLDRLLI